MLENLKVWFYILSPSLATYFSLSVPFNPIILYTIQMLMTHTFISSVTYFLLDLRTQMSNYLLEIFMWMAWKSIKNLQTWFFPILVNSFLYSSPGQATICKSLMISLYPSLPTHLSLNPKDFTFKIPVNPACLSSSPPTPLSLIFMTSNGPWVGSWLKSCTSIVNSAHSS